MLTTSKVSGLCRLLLAFFFKIAVLIYSADQLAVSSFTYIAFSFSVAASSTTPLCFFFEALVHCGCASMKCKWWKQTSWSHTVWWSGFCPLMVAALEETYCNVWHGSSRPAEIYTMSLKNEVEESCRSMDMVREPTSKLDQKYSALWSSITTLTLFFFSLLTDSGWRFWWEFVWASSGDISERSCCNSSILHRPRHHWPPGGVRLPTALPAVWHG